ncbi:MAG: ADP-forming succinate--CoA ligase subunit beta [Thermoprotei archaeon]|nr:MAG: ADP-forming succinate--CoA ligase subunit beta [Thermoprotei archaeon]
MKIHEYIARDIFSKYGIPIPRGFIVTSLNELEKILNFLKPPLVLKAQVLVASRGKKGGILFAETRDECLEKAERLFKLQIDGLPVRKILVVEKIRAQKELYVGFVVNRGDKCISLLASKYGGMDLEEIARKDPSSILNYKIDPLVGYRSYMGRNIAFKLGIKEYSSQLTRILESLYRVFIDNECELAEINPLAVTEEKLVALDTRMIIDDNSLFRHPFFRKEKKEEFNYVELEGDVGVIGNGAGLTMATMDLISHYGGKPANFLDIGGGARANMVKEALLRLLSNPNIKVIFINILGGITRCDEVAKGIVEALEEGGRKPIVVRLKGTNEEEGFKILRCAGVEVYDDMEEAAKKAVELAKREV